MRKGPWGIPPPPRTLRRISALGAPLLTCASKAYGEPPTSSRSPTPVGAPTPGGVPTPPKRFQSIILWFQCPARVSVIRQISVFPHKPLMHMVPLRSLPRPLRPKTPTSMPRPLRPPVPLRLPVPLRQVVPLRRRNGFSPSFSGFSAPHRFQCPIGFQCLCMLSVPFGFQCLFQVSMLHRKSRCPEMVRDANERAPHSDATVFASCLIYYKRETTQLVQCSRISPPLRAPCHQPKA